jgi:DNA-binding transcriptional LysR family regulator
MSLDSRLLAGAGTFVAVVEAGSFKRGGEMLGITQSGVSRAVARLEAQMGIRLFHRNARAVVLTHEGRKFYEEVQPHLAGIEDAAKLASGASEKVSGHLRVNTDTPFGHSLLVVNLGAFLGEYPDLTLDLLVRDHIGDLVADGFDIAIRFGRPHTSGLIARKLSDTRVLTCASPDYIKRRGLPQQPLDLVHDEHECILIRDPSTRRPFNWDFQKEKESLRVDVKAHLTVSDSVSLLSACMSGFGVAQTLEIYASDHIQSGELVQLFPDWSDELYPLFAYLPTKRHPSARVRVFLDFVAKLSRNDRKASAELLKSTERLSPVESND